MDKGWIVFEGEKGADRFLKDRHKPDETLVPFSSNSKEKEYTDFSGVAGAFSRIMSDIVLEKNMDHENLKSKIRGKMYECKDEDFEVLFHIIESIYFENKTLLPVNIKALNFIDSNDSHDKVARYLYGLFIENTDLQEKYKDD